MPGRVSMWRSRSSQSCRRKSRNTWDLTPSEAAELSKLLDNFIRIVEATDVQARLEALERKARL